MKDHHLHSLSEKMKMCIRPMFYTFGMYELLFCLFRIYVFVHLWLCSTMKLLIRVVTLCVRIFNVLISVGYNSTLMISFSVATWYNEGHISLFTEMLMMFVNMLQKTSNIAIQSDTPLNLNGQDIVIGVIVKEFRHLLFVAIRHWSMGPLYCRPQF